MKISKKQLSAKKQSKVLRTTPAPPKLQELIDLVNQLPDVPLPSWNAIDALARQRNEDAGDLFRQILGQLPSKLREFVGSLPERQPTIHKPGLQDIAVIAEGIPETLEVIERYNLLVDGRRLLRDLALWYALSYFHTQITVGLTVVDGRLALKPSRLWECVEGIDLVRLRQCLICDKFFWAGRIDRWACSKRCGQVMRTRKSREDYAEKQRLAKTEANRKPSPSRTEPSNKSKGKKHGS